MLSIGMSLLLVAVAAPAWANHGENPLLSVGSPSASVVAPGDTISIPFEVQDPETTRSVTFRFKDGLGGTRYLFAESEGGQPLPNTAAAVVNEQWYPGEYTIHSVTVWSPSQTNGVQYDYYPDGSIGIEGGDDHTHGTHDLDLSVGTFTVENDAIETDAPVLDSMEMVSAGPYGFGDDIEVAWAAHDESGLGEVYFEYEDPTGQIQIFSTNFVPEGVSSGVAKGRVGYRWPSGISNLIAVLVVEDYERDREITATYHPDGRITTDPPLANHAETHDFDFSAMSVEIDNPEWDVEWPEIESLSRTSDRVLYPGESLSVDYQVADPHFMEIDLRYREPGSDWHDLMLLRDDSGSLAGRLTHLIEDLPAGTYETSVVQVSDLGMNYQALHRNGYLDTQPWTSARHDVDLSAFDFEVRAWPHVFADSTDRGRISLALEAKKLRIEIGDDSIVLGNVYSRASLNGKTFVTAASQGASVSGYFVPATGVFHATGAAFGSPFVLSS
jgi:hypothetical protein